MPHDEGACSKREHPKTEALGRCLRRGDELMVNRADPIIAPTSAPTIKLEKRNQGYGFPFVDERADSIKPVPSSILLHPPLLIKIMTPILQVLNSAVVARAGKVFQA